MFAFANVQYNKIYKSTYMQCFQNIGGRNQYHGPSPTSNFGGDSPLVSAPAFRQSFVFLCLS